MSELVLLTTDLARGGAENQVAQLAVAMRRRGWPVSVVSLIAPSAHETELRDAGVAVHSAEMRPGVASATGMARLIWRLHRLRPRIVHAHMFHANIAARFLRLVCPFPVAISTIHSAAESSRRSGSVRQRDFAYRLTDRLSDATVCVSAAVATRHRETRAVATERLRVIPNGVDTGRFRPNPARRARAREALGLGAGFAWLAVGRLMWKKDYPTLLRAMRKQTGGALLIAGEGPQEGELRALADELAAPVRFLGAREDIPELMNAADALVLSSSVEGLPMVLLEAAASGLPTVATRAGGVAEAVLDGQTGYLAPPGDAEALSAAMSRLAALAPEARAAMAAAGRLHAERQFDMQQVAERWESLYLELLKQARRAAREPEPEGPHA